MTVFETVCTISHQVAAGGFGDLLVLIRDMYSEQAWNYENAFYWFSPPSRLDKMLAHYEIYKRIIALPGHVVELGVYKAASLIRFASFRRLLETDTSRKIIAFDAFGKFPHSQEESPSDSEFISRFEMEGGDGLSAEEVQSVLAAKGFRNIDLVGGDILAELPSWLKANPQARISLLHIDTDVYEPARLALEILWERMVPGGLVVLDDYNAVEGETRAVDEFLKREKLSLEKLPFYTIPSFITKP